MYNTKTLKILKKYAPYLSELGGLTEAEWHHLEENGLILGTAVYSHNEICELALTSYKDTDRTVIIKTFLQGLATNDPFYRCALSAYSIMTKFYLHDFYTTNSEQISCVICAQYRENKEYLTFLNRLRLHGSVSSSRPTELYFNLKFAPQDYEDDLVVLGEQVLINILSCIHRQKENLPPRLIVREIKKVLPKFNKHDCSFLLETLGFCGILQPADRLCYLDKYVWSVEQVQKTHSSDWRYPVDFWTVQDGINGKALEHWFGDFKHIKKWIDNNL